MTELMGVAQRCLLFVAPLLLLLAAWQVTTSMGYVRPLFLPPPGSVAEQFLALLQAGEILEQLAISLYRAFAGLAIATAVGVATGLMMARISWVNWICDPLISFVYPAPKIVFIPLFILYFGMDHLSKILLVALTCVFPMIIATHQGASTVSRTLVWSAESMGTSERRLLSRVILPASMPAILTGVRITMPAALITAFTCEMVAGGGGLGAALVFAQRFFETPTVFVYILVMLMTGLVLDLALLRLRNVLLPWHEQDKEL
ncbi:MAG: ABC transporter permease [Hyphomicrobiaceae bacterium]|nr:ABC transporter permease [Hyphomicrobiaceae bacterium]